MSTPIVQNTRDLRLILDMINALFGGSSPSTSNILYLVDHSTDLNYMVYVSNGKLLMETTTNTDGANYIYFIDQSTSQIYAVYVSNGSLNMDMTDSVNENNKTITLLDQTTSEKYSIYVLDGKLTMVLTEE